MEIFLGAFTAEWEQRKAAFLHDLTLGRRGLTEEDERRRRGGGVAPAGAITMGKSSSFRSRWGAGSRSSEVQSRADRPMRARFAGLASGSQPAVVKMASFGGGSRLGAMINYVSRNGAVVVENERGDQLRGRDQLCAVGDEWDHLMKNRAESRDIGLFKITVTENVHADDLTDRSREIIRHALGDRSFVFAATARKDRRGFEINGVVVLRDSHGERLTADKKAATIVQSRIVQSRAGVTFRFIGYGNGTDYGTSQVRSLVEAHGGKVQDEQGRSINDAKKAGDLVQLEWRDQLHSRKPRDVMHLVLSARAGTDSAAFYNAARDFLGQQFASHRYVFSLHDAASDPKVEGEGGKRPHVHVHAIVAMRSDAGDRIETTIRTFRQWRSMMAEKARAHGLNMEMTDRRDRASAPSYSKNQVRPLNKIGRTDHEGTSAAAARRYLAKRDDLSSHSVTNRSQVYMQRARAVWQEIIKYKDHAVRMDFVLAQIARLSESRVRDEIGRDPIPEAGNSTSQFRTYLVKLTEIVSEGDDMRHMTRPEFEAYEKRVETALFQAQKTMLPNEREDFEEIAQVAREHVNVRREIVELLEARGPSGVSEQQSQTRAADQEMDDKQRWNEAVERHGFSATVAANKVLVDIERTREAIQRTATERPDELPNLNKELYIHVTKAAELGASGNGIIREVAEFDNDLKAAMHALERDRQRREDEKSTSKAQFDVADRDKGLQREIGEATKSDAAKQHFHRREEIQRETNKRIERDQDDRE
jgi:hypothetical protein